MKYIKTVILLLSLTTYKSANAQWQTVYDSGSRFTEVYADGNNIILKNSLGLAISKNDGKSWQQTDTSLDLRTSPRINRIDSVLIASFIAGNYISVDSGMSWELWSRWPKLSYPDPFGPPVLSGKNLVSASKTNRFITSGNYGATWDTAYTGLPQTLKSPPPKAQFRNFSGFAITGNNILGFVDNTEYISYDHGRTWNFKRDTMPFSGLYKYFTHGNDIYAAYSKLYVSHDSGDNWISAFSPISSSDGFRGMGAKGNVFFAVDAGEGVIVSKDSGQNWIFSNKGLTTFDLGSIAINTNYIFCSAANGKVFRRPINEFTDISIKSLPSELVRLKVYPNPVSHSATFEFGRELINGKLKVYNIQGEEVIKIENINDKKVQLFKGNLASGIYIYIISESDIKLATGELKIS